jgi:hypothetical protein
LNPAQTWTISAEYMLGVLSDKIYQVEVEPDSEAEKDEVEVEIIISITMKYESVKMEEKAVIKLKS